MIRRGASHNLPETSIVAYVNNLYNGLIEMINTKANISTVNQAIATTSHLLSFPAGGTQTPENGDILGPDNGILLTNAGTLRDLSIALVWTNQDSNSWGDVTVTVTVRRATSSVTPISHPGFTQGFSDTGYSVSASISGPRDAQLEDLAIFSKSGDTLAVEAGDRINMTVTATINGMVGRIFAVTPSVIYSPVGSG